MNNERWAILNLLSHLDPTDIHDLYDISPFDRPATAMHVLAMYHENIVDIGAGGVRKTPVFNQMSLF